MDNLHDLRYALQDAEEAISRAADLAYDVSGYEGGRQAGEWDETRDCPGCNGTGLEVTWEAVEPWSEIKRACPGCEGQGTYVTHESDPGEPAVEGWPAMLALHDRLMTLLAQFRATGQISSSYRPPTTPSASASR